MGNVGMMSTNSRNCHLLLSVVSGVLCVDQSEDSGVGDGVWCDEPLDSGGNLWTVD